MLKRAILGWVLACAACGGPAPDLNAGSWSGTGQSLTICNGQSTQASVNLAVVVTLQSPGLYLFQIDGCTAEAPFLENGLSIQATTCPGSGMVIFGTFSEGELSLTEQTPAGCNDLIAAMLSR